MDKKYTLMWSVSLLVIAAIAVVNCFCSIAMVEIPDLFMRIMGIADICAIPVLIFSSIKLRIFKKNSGKDTETDTDKN